MTGEPPADAEVLAARTAELEAEVRHLRKLASRSIIYAICLERDDDVLEWDERRQNEWQQFREEMCVLLREWAREAKA